MIDTLRKIAEKVREAVDLMPEPEKGEEIGIGADGTPTKRIDYVAEKVVLDFIEANDVPLSILSEEAGFVDRGFDDVLILDPVDGTTNSINGIPMYAISMAVGRGDLSGVHTAYVMNLATCEEFTAIKGEGAYHNGIRVHCKEDFNPRSAKMAIYLGIGADPKSFKLAQRIKSTRSFGCSSLEMVMVATGAIDGHLLNSNNYRRSTRIVDIAASVLILREAGGEVYSLDGTPLNMPYDLAVRSNYLAVGNRAVFDYVMDGNLLLSLTGKLRYGIYANMSIKNVTDVAKRILALMDGQDVVLDTGIADALGVKGTSIDEMDVDVVITLGGDGTILRAIHHTDAAIIGVNAGGVGFLTDIPLDSIDEGIKRLLKGDYTIQNRPKITAMKDGKILGEAVNEMVIHSDSVAKIRRFKIYVNDSLTTEIRSDGIVLSTPIGSTSYAMSLGGPIMDHRVDAWIMVPMAAYESSFRQMVVPTSLKITVDAVLDKGCLLVIDGQKEIPLEGGSRVEFTRSPEPASFIVFETDFYSRVREKLVRRL